MAVGTRDSLLQTAESLMRTKGYAAFSYADLSETVGIRKASIHHHFPTKEDLGIAIVESSIARTRSDFERIEREHPGVLARSEAFFKIFRDSGKGGLLPLCGALAAEMSALPPDLQRLTQHYFDMQLTWLTTILEQGVSEGQIPTGGGARHKAFVLLSTLEGASLINWATREQGFLDVRIVRLLIEEA